MTAVSTATRRAERFFAEVADEFGERSGEIVTIPMRQCELARRKAVAASTVAAHVRAMGERVLQRRPTIVITDGGPQRTPQRTPQRPPQMTPAADHGAELIHALNDVVEAQQRVISLLMESATNSSRIVAESRGNVADFAVQGSSRVPVSKEEAFLLTDETSFRDDRRGNVAESRATSEVAPWSQTELDRVLAPLHDAVQRRGLKPMNNRTALTSALTDFGLGAIEAAVQRLIPMTAAGTASSPFGLLVSWARRGEDQMFAVAHDSLPGPGSPPVIADVDDAVDETAVRAVKDWEAEPDIYCAELAALDQRIVADNGTVPLLDEVAPMRHAFRVEAFLNTFGRCTDIEAAPGSSASANAFVNPPGHPGQ